MEVSRLANYHDSDAQPTVDGLHPEDSTSAILDEFPTSPARILRDDLDPYNQKLDRPSFFRSSFQTIKAFPKHAKELVCSERINVLLVFAPIAITVGFLEVDPIVDFILNALAIIPLAVVISTATESIASRLGDTLGALLNVTVGNTAELMIFFVALAKNQIRIVQASLLGSVLANLLMVLGTAFLAGGLRFANQLQDRPAGHLSVGLLDFGLLIAMFPVAFLVASSRATTAQIKREVLAISRGTSIALIVIYVMYLIYQMRAQSYMRVSEDQYVAQMDGRDSFPLSRLQHKDIGRRPNFMKLSSGTTRARWLKWFGKSDARQQYNAAPQADDTANSLLRRTTSLEDLGTTTRPDQLEKERTGRRSRSVEARPNQRYHSPEESIARFDWQDFSHANRGQSMDDNDSDTSQSDYTATASTLQSTLPPSPPSTPPTPSNPRLISSRHRTLLSLQERCNKWPLPDSESLRWARLPRHGSDPTFERTNTLAELYEYRRYRTQQSQTPLPIAIAVLVVATSLVSVCTEDAVDAIPPIVESWGVSRIFLGFIVLPLVGNASEHIIAAKLASNNKMVLAKNVAVESSAQIVLFIMPAVVLIGWIRHLDMSLQFDIFEIATIVMTSVVASILVCRGKADWKQGVLLHSIFWIVSLGAVIYPTVAKAYGRRGNMI